MSLIIECYHFYSYHVAILVKYKNLPTKEGDSMSNGPKFHSLGHDLSQILMKLLQMKGIYEIRLS